MSQQIINLLRSIDRKLGRIAESISADDGIDDERQYSRREAARILNCTAKTIDRKVKDGLLDVVKSGKSVRIRGRSLKRIWGIDQRIGAVSVQKI